MRPAFSTTRPVAALGPSVRLPAQDLAQIRFIVAAADMRANVRRMALLLSGRNAAAAAEAIAKELRRDLYRIDLAAVISKFIGETEKNSSASSPRPGPMAQCCCSTKPMRCLQSALM